MDQPRIVDRNAWTAARLALLEKEKALTRMRDEVAAARRALPRTRVAEDYRFDGPKGVETLGGLFAGRSQLIVYHFMFGPGWEVGCKSCSFLADHFEPAIIHLAQRDVTMVAVSRAPRTEFLPFQRRMGWTFPWYSSAGTAFNQDYGVSFDQVALDDGSAVYNYRKGGFPATEAPGASVFVREGDTIYHSYSTYARGLDPFIGTYQWLDIVPKGRDEAALHHTMAWVNHHDRYDGS